MRACPPSLCAHGHVLHLCVYTGGFVSSLSRSVGAHVHTLNQPSLVGTSWEAAEASTRLEAAIAYEEQWLTQRANAVANAAAKAGEAPPAAQQDDGAPARRSKRARAAVDYDALEATLQSEEGEPAKKAREAEE